MVDAHGFALEPSASVDRDLAARAQVEDVTDPELAGEVRDVARCQGVQRIAAKQHAPAQSRPLARRIAAEIAEVVTALELDRPLRHRF